MISSRRTRARPTRRARPRSPRKSARSSVARTRSRTRARGVNKLTAQVETATGTGRVARIIGPVVDAEFPADAMPEIFNALQVEVTFGDEPKILTLEVAQHLGDNMV